MAAASSRPRSSRRRSWSLPRGRVVFGLGVTQQHQTAHGRNLDSVSVWINLQAHARDKVTSAAAVRKKTPWQRLSQVRPTVRTTTRRFASRLSFDLDVDICVVGAGLAGLTVALEAARLGASVAVLEGRHVGWNASGHQLGTVMPGYGLPIGELIERVGLEDARELWALSKEGADYVRAAATEEAMPGIALTEGRAGSLQRRCRRYADQPAADAGRGFRDRSRGLAGRSRPRSAQDRALFPRHLLSQGVPDRRPQICPRPGRAGKAGRRAHLRGHAGRQHRSIRHSQAHRDAVGAAARLPHRAGRQHPSRRAVAAAVGDAAAGLALCRRHRAARRAACRGHHLPGLGDRQRRHRSFPDRRRRPADVGEPGNHLGRAAAPLRRRHRSAASPRSFRKLGKVAICGGVRRRGRTDRARHAADRPVAQRPVGRERLRPPGAEHLGDGGAADRAQHPVGRRALAAVFAVRTGLGGRRDRPGRRPSDRHVGAGQFRRRRRAGPLPRRRAGAGSGSARRGWPKPTGRPERGRRRRRPPPGQPRPVRPQPPAPVDSRRKARRPPSSQESEKIRDGSV